MLDQLYVKQIARPIEQEGIRPVIADVYEWSKLDRRCLGYIRDYIDVGVIHHVENTTTTFDWWKKLQGLYERKTAGHMVGLVRQLGKLRFLGNFIISLSASAVDGIISKEMVSNVILNEELRRGCNGNARSSINNNDTLVYEKKKVFKKKEFIQVKHKERDKKDDQCHYCDKTRH
ncbi:hypothetical protein LIER_19419 [Lithospermum erythrorhizon]|uniref:Polyprotein n=1 Tax=Lithospermum erythrorhizon TaxID=34254 RepID=A0AAV3QM11_LITER